MPCQLAKDKSPDKNKAYCLLYHALLQCHSVAVFIACCCHPVVENQDNIIILLLMISPLSAAVQCCFCDLTDHPAQSVSAAIC